MQKILGKEESDIFHRNIWMSSKETVQAGMIIIRDPEDSVVETEKLLLLPLNVEDLNDVNWENYTDKHREYLNTSEGLDAIKRKVEAGVFGICKTCGVQMLPFCSEYKLYRDNLKARCPCCEKANTLYPYVEGVVYGDVLFIESVQNLPWVLALRKRCP